MRVASQAESQPPPSSYDPFITTPSMSHTAPTHPQCSSPWPPPPSGRVHATFALPKQPTPHQACAQPPLLLPSPGAFLPEIVSIIDASLARWASESAPQGAYSQFKHMTFEIIMTVRAAGAPSLGGRGQRGRWRRAAALAFFRASRPDPPPARPPILAHASQPRPQRPRLVSLHPPTSGYPPWLPAGDDGQELHGPGGGPAAPHVQHLHPRHGACTTAAACALCIAAHAAPARAAPAAVPRACVCAGSVHAAWPCA